MIAAVPSYMTHCATYVKRILKGRALLRLCTVYPFGPLALAALPASRNTITAECLTAGLLSPPPSEGCQYAGIRRFWQGRISRLCGMSMGGFQSQFPAPSSVD